MSIRSRIERLEREFLPQERHEMTFTEFNFLRWGVELSKAEFKALPRGIRTQYEILYRVFEEGRKNYEEEERLRLSTSKGKGPAAPAPKTRPKPTPSDSQST